MASSQSQLDFVAFLNYHGTNVGDSLLYRYIEMFANFCQYRNNNPQLISFDKAYIKWKQQYQTTPTLLLPYLAKEIPTFPHQTTPYSTPPIVVSATSTTTLMDKSSNNDDDVETQAVQAANQLIANYINTENYLMEDIPDLFETVEPLTSPTSSTSLSPMPELQSLPPPPPPTPSSPEPPAEKPTPVAHKDIDVMKKIEAEKKNPNSNKRKRVANITPQPGKRAAGRPSTHETLTKIANDEINNDKISSQNLILRCLDGTEKRKKTILTCSQENIELYNAKQFSCYEFLGELRKKALDNIKEQKSILEHILYIEKMVTQNIERKKKKQTPCKYKIFIIKQIYSFPNPIMTSFLYPKNTQIHPFVPIYPQYQPHYPSLPPAHPLQPINA